MGFRLATGLTTVEGKNCIVLKARLLSGKWLTYTWMQDIRRLVPARQEDILRHAEDKVTFKIRKAPEKVGNINLWGTSALAKDAILLLRNFIFINASIDPNVLAREVLGAVLFSQWCDRCGMFDIMLSLSKDGKLHIKAKGLDAKLWFVTISSKPRQRAVDFCITNSGNLRYDITYCFKEEIDLFNNAYHAMILDKVVNLSSYLKPTSLRSVGDLIRMGTKGVEARIDICFFTFQYEI